VASTNNTDLTRGEADLAVRLRPPTSGDLVVRKLGTIAMGLYASSRFVERLPAGIRLRDLEVVGFAADVGRVPMSKWLEEHVARPPVLTSNHLPTLRRAAQLGLGAAVLGELEATLHDLVPVPIEHPPLPEVPWYLVTHAALRAVPRVRAVADFLLDLVRRPPAELRALQDPEPTRGSGRGRTRSSRG
jgi:DNA-binding transcriptional LysR family regulator